MTPAQVSPTTAAKMSAAAMDPPTKNTYLNSDLDRKFCKYLMNATAWSRANTPENKYTSLNEDL